MNEIRLPDEYDPERIAEILSKALKQIETKAEDKKMREITTAGANPPDIEENELRFHLDGDTREVIFRNQNRTYVISTTKR